MRALLALALALAFALPVGAEHCVSYSTYPALEAGGYYVTEDCYVADVLAGGLPGECLVIMSLWVYEESNGIPGLQRDDEVVDTTCHGTIEGDTVVL